MTFHWNRARAFLATMEHGTLGAAGRSLGIAQPTVGRQIMALEQELGAALFERVGQRLLPTPIAHALVEHVQAMQEAAERVARVASAQTQSLTGRVSVSASETITAFLLPPVVMGMRRHHPGIELDLIATDDTSDLLRRDADIAVRNFAPTEPDLVARRVIDRAACLYATPAYLHQVGPVETLDDLGRTEILAWNREPMLMEGLRALGARLTPSNFPLVCTSHLAQWGMCRAGVGLCLMLTDAGDPDPAVVRVLPGQLPLMPMPVWLTTHRDLRTNRRLRVVFDALADALDS